MRDVTADYDFLILPGLGNSGVDHWQSYWALAFRNGTRVLQDDWDNPKLADFRAACAQPSLSAIACRAR